MSVFYITLTANNTPTLIQGQTFTDKGRALEELATAGDAAQFFDDCLVLSGMDLIEYLNNIGVTVDPPIRWGWVITEE